MRQRLPFLGGRPMVRLEERMLATEAEVLRRLIGWSGNIVGSVRSPSAISCKLDRQRVATCYKPGQCQEKNKSCFIFEVKRKFISLFQKY